jgi:hypothetical protein
MSGVSYFFPGLKKIWKYRKILHKSSVSIFTLIRQWESRWFMQMDVQTDRRDESDILLLFLFIYLFAISLRKPLEKEKEGKKVS